MIKAILKFNTEGINLPDFNSKEYHDILKPIEFSDLNNIQFKIGFEKFREINNVICKSNHRYIRDIFEDYKNILKDVKLNESNQPSNTETLLNKDSSFAQNLRKK
jgi:hypothetical protein